MVSIIIPTFNESKNIDKCLVSISIQSYTDVEVIVVDSLNTTDNTAIIAKSLGARVFKYGSERSQQRNYGVKMAKGKFVLIIDADMTMDLTVVQDCVEQLATNVKGVGVIIPEKSYGQTYWARCKSLEKNCYIGDDSIEAARFMQRKVYLNVGGYDSAMVSGEDWDLNRRIKEQGSVLRVSSFIQHNEGRLSLIRDLQKKYYYSRKSEAYIQTNVMDIKQVILFIFRPAYFKNWKILLKDPIHLPGLVLMKFLELAVGGFGAILFRKSFWGRLFRSET